MKRLFMYFVATALLCAGLWSCEKEEDNNNTASGGGNNGGGEQTPFCWVDLGLPSGLLWADRNVGANSPEDYGNYYKWGETTPNDGNGYRFSINEHQNGWGVTLTKYCTTPSYGHDGFADDLTVLEPCDDAATVNIGNGAHTPTENDWMELIYNTNSTWTTVNGVIGFRFISSNGNSIFLPATQDHTEAKKQYYHYWTSNLCVYPSVPFAAHCIRFDSNNMEMSAEIRWSEYPVRAVKGEDVNNENQDVTFE